MLTYLLFNFLFIFSNLTTLNGVNCILYILHREVFVVAQADDTHSYHIQFEIMPKIIYHLKFLLDNPQVKILIGCDFTTDKNRNMFFLFFMTRLISVFLKRCGISKDRLIVQKNVFAEIVYLPTSGNQLDSLLF